MTHEIARKQIQSRILSAVRTDPRIAGCLDYGSTGHGRGDQLSDLDLLLIIRDDSLAEFEEEWQKWAAQFGDLLLAYNSFVGHPWAVYDTGSTPLRVDFSFRPVSFIAQLPEIPLSPPSADTMVLYDDTAGELTTAVQQLVGKSLALADPRSEFTRATGDFWYMLLRCHTRLLRGDYWAARIDYHAFVLNNLMALMRIENGATGSWQAANPADGLEEAISVRRQTRLRSCVPTNDNQDLERAMYAAALLGAEVCAQIHQSSAWAWPDVLAAQTIHLFQPGTAAPDDLPQVLMKPIGIVENDVNELLPPDKIKAHPSRIIVDPALEDGLDGLTGGQRLLVVFQFHLLSIYELHQHPRNNLSLPKRGVFALHSPKRPNPIGVTEVDLLRREGNILHVRGLDAVNGTPILDLKLNR